jgi:hypothetical protein
MDEFDLRLAFAPMPCMETVTPLPAASFATGTPVRLLPENSIIHNHKYLALCIEVPPRAAARLSPCATVEASGHLEAQFALSILHVAAEPSVFGAGN